MPQTVQLKRSSVAAKVPLTTDLSLGEIAINTNDGRLFFKKDPGTPSIVEVATLDGTQTISGAKTFTGGAYFGEVVSRAGSSTEGGQVVLGYANNTTATGQGNSTWNIDVNDFTNQSLRFFRVNSSGVPDVALTIPDTGAITVNRSLTLGTNGISANGTFGTAGQVLATNGSAVYWTTAGSGSGATNLTYSANGSTITVLSDTGTDAVVLAANSTVAGVLTAEAQTIGGAKTFTASTTTFGSEIKLNGASGALTAGHTGTYGYFLNTTGVTDISGSGINLLAGDGSITHATFSAAGGAQLRFNDVVRLQTTSSGATVTGNLAITSTVTSGTWNGSVIGSTYGGTGVNNGGRTLTINTGNLTVTSQSAGSSITLGGNISTANSVTTSGNFALTLTTTAATSVTLPTSGTLISSADTGTVTSTMIANGTIVDADINSAAAIAVSKLAASTISGVTLGNNLNAVTFNNGGTGAASGSNFNGSAAVTVSYNTIGASPLAGSTSLTTLGTVTTGTWNGSVISSTYGGTGVNNGGRTLTLNTGNLTITPQAAGSSITLGGNITTANSVTTSGNFALTLTTTAATNVTLPTTGTLSTLAGTETFTNKTISSGILTGTLTANGSVGAAGQLLASNSTGTYWTTIDPVLGPASSTDNEIPRFNGTTGKLIKGSGAYLDSLGITLNAASQRFGWDVANTFYNWIGVGGGVSDNYIRFALNNTERMRINTLGDVGIGTNDPFYPVHVVRSTNASVLIGVENSQANTFAGSGISLTTGVNSGDIGLNSSATTTFGGANAMRVRNQANGPLILYTNNSERVRIHASGGVSIGNTTDPGITNLSVSGNVAIGAAVTSGAWNGSVISSTYGGTGVNNGGRTLTINTGNLTVTSQSAGSSITLGGNISTANSVTTSGNFALTLTTTAATSVTLPTSGTLISSADTGTVTSTMIANNTIVDADINSAAAIAVTKLAASTISGVTLGNNLNSVTFNNGGAGAASGSTFNGSAAVTVSYNTIGASPLAGSTSLTTLGTITTGTWNGSTIAIANGGTGETVGPIGYTALRGYLSVTAGSTQTLTSSSPNLINVIGAAATTINLPDVTTLTLGRTFVIRNSSGGFAVTVRTSTAATVVTIAANSEVRLIALSTSDNTAAGWAAYFTGFSGTSGGGNVVRATSPSISGLTLTGTLTANSSVGTAGQVLTSSATGVYWSTPSAGSTAVPVSDTAPGSPTNGTMWFDSSDGTLNIYYNDGTSSQWVSAVNNQTDPAFRIKTSNYTASNRDNIIADTSAGSFTITLPASPTAGQYVTIYDNAGWGTNNLTIARNGSTIENLADDFILDVSSIKVEFIYNGSTWQIYSSVAQTGSGLAAASINEVAAIAIALG